MQQSPVTSASPPRTAQVPAGQASVGQALVPDADGRRSRPCRTGLICRLALAACVCLVAAAAPAFASTSTRAVMALLEMKEMLRAEHDDLSSLARSAKPGHPIAKSRKARLENGANRFESRRARFLALIPGAKQRFPEQAPILERARRDVDLWSRDLAALTRPATTAVAAAPAAPSASSRLASTKTVLPANASKARETLPAMTRLPAPVPAERPAVVTHEQIQDLASRLKSRKVAAIAPALPRHRAETALAAPAVSATPPAESRDQLRARLAHLMTKFQVSAEPYKYAKVAPATPTVRAAPVPASTTRRAAGNARGRDLWQESERIQQRLRQLQRDTQPQSGAAPSEPADELTSKALESAGGPASETDKAELKSRLKSLLLGNDAAAPVPPATPAASPPRQSSRTLETAPGGKAMAHVIRTAERSSIHLEDIEGLVTTMGAPPVGETTGTTSPAETASEPEALMSTGVAASLGVSPESTDAGETATETAEAETAPAPKVVSAPRPLGLTGVYEIITDEDKAADRPSIQDEVGTHNFEGPDGNGESVYQIIRTLAEQLKLNIVIKGVIPGKMLLNVDGQSTWDVLESVLNDQGLEYELQPGNVLKIWGAGIRPIVQKTYKFATDQNVRVYEGLIQSLVFQTQEEAVAPSEQSGPQGGLEIPAGTTLEVPGAPGGAPGGPGGAPGDPNAQPGGQPAGPPFDQGQPQQPPEPPPQPEGGEPPPQPAQDLPPPP